MGSSRYLDLYKSRRPGCRRGSHFAAARERSRQQACECALHQTKRPCDNVHKGDRKLPWRNALAQAFCINTSSEAHEFSSETASQCAKGGAAAVTFACKFGLIQACFRLTSVVCDLN